MGEQPTRIEPVVAIVVAAGSGIRLGGDVPKALRLVGGRPLVARSVEQLAAGGCTVAVVVIAPGLADDFAEALSDAPIPVQLVVGGAERADSVRNGLAAVTADPELAEARIVLVHDAARALVPVAVVERVVAAVRGGAVAVVPVVPVVNSIRALHDVGSSVVDRSMLRAVQTPQGFDLQTLIDSHDLVVEHSQVVTDDAAACEFAGHHVTLVDGDRQALKITEPLDLVIAEAIVEGRA